MTRAVADVDEHPHPVPLDLVHPRVAPRRGVRGGREHRAHGLILPSPAARGAGSATAGLASPHDAAAPTAQPGAPVVLVEGESDAVVVRRACSPRGRPRPRSADGWGHEPRPPPRRPRRTGPGGARPRRRRRGALRRRSAAPARRPAPRRPRSSSWHGVFVCDRDLEDVLIGALGPGVVVRRPRRDGRARRLPHVRADAAVAGPPGGRPAAPLRRVGLGPQGAARGPPRRAARPRDPAGAHGRAGPGGRGRAT